MTSLSRKVSLLAVSIVATLALAACGGGEDEAAPAAAQGPSNQVTPPSNPPPAGSTNQAPTIGGTPSAQVLQGAQFNFLPTANDPNGDSLSFSVVNKPVWASFDAATGRLSGTPGAADVGTYANIRISVSDGVATTNLPAFSVAVVATAFGSATLTWEAPTQNTDGSPAALTGFKIYWGTSEGTYSNSVSLSNPGLSSYVVDQLTPATWYFVVTALSASGESEYSNVGQKIIR